jgi:hypothetical protein
LFSGSVPKEKTVQVDLSVIEGKYLREILDQPRALENTLVSLLENPSLRE